MRFLIKLFFLVSLCFLYFILQINQINAFDDLIKINEFIPNPDGSDSDYEWIELYNLSSSEIFLNNCTLASKNIPNINMKPGEYIIFARDLIDKDNNNASFEQFFGNNNRVWGDSEDEDFEAYLLDFSINNTSGQIDFVCDNFTTSVSWNNSKTGYSYARNLNSEYELTSKLTPGKENLFNIHYQEGLLFSEIYPTPYSNEQEWIEFYNFLEKEISLDGWYIKDKSGSKYYFNSNLTVASKEYLMILSENLKISLNNSDEILYLYNYKDEIVETASYENIKTGNSLIRDFEEIDYLDNFYVTKFVTPGEKNIFIDPNDHFTNEEITNIDKLVEGEYAIIEGIVTVSANLFLKKTFYIQDSTSGIEVYSGYEEIIEDLKIGDKVLLYGKLKVLSSKNRFEIFDEFSIVTKNNTNKLEPKWLKLDQENSKYLNSLVAIHGKIVRTSGSSLYAIVDDKEIKILVKSSTGIEIPSKKRDQEIIAVGILTIYKFDEEGNPIYQVIPRVNEDILIGENLLAKTGYNVNLIVSFYLIINIIYVLFIKKMFIKNQIFSSSSIVKASEISNSPI